MPKNYYIILGIPSDSTQEDIKAAYRRLAKKFHPDHYGKSQSPFQIIHEAYTVLGNPTTRKNYDISLMPCARPVPTSTGITPLHSYPGEEIEPLIPEDGTRGDNITSVDRAFQQQWSIFDNVFGQFLGGFAERSRPHLNTGEMTIEITLSPAQAQRDGNVRLSLPVQMHCPSCYQHIRRGYTCWRCNGTGVLLGEKPLLVNYPAGIENNHTMKLAISDFGDQPLYLNVIFKIR